MTTCLWAVEEWVLASAVGGEDGPWLILMEVENGRLGASFTEEAPRRSWSIVN